MNDIFAYDTLTGIITWKIKPSAKVNIGQEAGTLMSTGYRQVRYKGKNWKSHVLAWFLYYGVWPKELDHRNNIRDDNRIKNLREVTRSQNNRNCTRVNKTGFKGVSRTPNGRFQALIREPNGKKKYLGTFDTAKQAHAVYQTNYERFFK